VLGDRLRRRVPPRAVDWGLFALLVFEAAGGLYAFTVGRPEGWYWVWSHRAAGLGFVGLLAAKLLRVRGRLTDADAWRPSTALSVATALAALATLATGVVWVSVGLVWVAAWPLLAIHVGLGLLLVPLVLAHLRTRFRPPRRADFADRRTALTYFGLLAAGGLAARLHDAVETLRAGPGADRRFTGSKPAAGTGNDGFPVTSWVADDPDPLDRSEYALRLTGRVGTELALPYDRLAGAGDASEASGTRLDRRTERALLDCTSGWYTVQNWRGVRVGDLLGAAGVGDDARYVRFVSVTGYRWSLPLGEARDALLATHVGDEPLSHGHGGPIRLVAPGRRGFQWVKWVTRVEVRSRGDPAQWVVTLVSGFE